MIDDDKFRRAHEGRRTRTAGVTLVGFYGEDKPRSLLGLVQKVAGGLTNRLSKYPGLVHIYGDWLHATVSGLEGSEAGGGEIVTDNMRLRAQNTGEQVRPFAVEGFLAFVRDSAKCVRFRFGGYKREDKNPHDEKRKPWQRTFEVRSDGLAVLMGWPLKGTGEPFASDLDDLRRDLQQFGVVHKYHLKATEVDNDLFTVVAALDYDVWRKLTPEEHQGICDQLQQYQEEVRKGLQIDPVPIELSGDRLWVVKYLRTTLEEVEFAKRVTEVTPGEIRSLYAPAVQRPA